jgi:hypothetical protein
MKSLFAGCVYLLTISLLAAPAGAAYKPLPNSTAFGGVEYGFRLEVLGEDGNVKSEWNADGNSRITAKRGERYTIRVYNPLPVRAAVNLTVDGVNTIDGKPCGIADGSKWMIDPHSWITIRGWQVNGGEARRFYFTNAKKSYAAWRGEKLKLDLEENCGVIGAAFFWNRGELARWQEAQVRPRRECRLSDDGRNFLGAASRADAQAAAERAKEQAGTGMGERETHLVQHIQFNADAGTFDPKDALVLFYGFEEPKRPNPFPALTFAPEMP